MSILVTGSSGFIGSALTLRLLNEGYFVIGVDNHNNYYDISLKEARLSRYIKNKNFENNLLDIKDTNKLKKVFIDHDIDIVVNLAAQAGVEYSTKKPLDYVNSNIVGFVNILECCKTFKIKHLVYASSSSVYGLNNIVPFSELHPSDHPVSLYGATKKSNELLAHSYSHVYNLPTTGLRFFTVYGPWDRPDMALQKFTKKIINREKIQLYNHGNHVRDFTYIDDIIEGVYKIIGNPPSKNTDWQKNPILSSSSAPWEIYNIGNNKPVKLEKYISTLENELGLIAQKEYLPMKVYDIEKTNAEILKIKNKFNFIPQITIEQGIKEFVKWYINYYNN